MRRINSPLPLAIVGEVLIVGNTLLMYVFLPEWVLFTNKPEPVFFSFILPIIGFLALLAIRLSKTHPQNALYLFLAWFVLPILCLYLLLLILFYEAYVIGMGIGVVALGIEIFKLNRRVDFDDLKVNLTIVIFSGFLFALFIDYHIFQWMYLELVFRH